MMSRTIIVLLVLIVCLCTPVLFPSTEIARQQYERGKNAFEKGEYTTAVEKFGAAQTADPAFPEPDYYLYLIYSTKLENPQKAAAHYEKYNSLLTKQIVASLEKSTTSETLILHGEKAVERKTEIRGTIISNKDISGLKQPKIEIPELPEKKTGSVEILTTSEKPEPAERALTISQEGPGAEKKKPFFSTTLREGIPSTATLCTCVIENKMPATRFSITFNPLYSERKPKVLFFEKPKKETLVIERGFYDVVITLTGAQGDVYTMLRYPLRRFDPYFLYTKTFTSEDEKTLFKTQ